MSSQTRRALLVCLIGSVLLASNVSAGASAQVSATLPAGSGALPIQFTQPVLVMMAMGNTAAVNAMIANGMAREFQQAQTSRAGAWTVESWVMPEPTWSLNDFVAQCKNFDNQVNIRGAFVALPASIQSGENNILGIYQRAHTQVAFDVFFTTCATAVSNDGISITWQTGVHQVAVFRNSYSLIPLGLLVSLYTALAPTHSSSSVTTTVYPTPQPLPAGGTVSSTTKTSTTTVNGNSGSTGAAFLSGLAAFSGNTLRTIPISEILTQEAVDRIAHDVVNDVKCSCTELREGLLSEKERKHCVSAQTPPADPLFCTWIHPKAK